MFVLLAVGLALHARTYDYVADDAFISLRYASNLVSEEGLVYNPGERVEGYTNFLWVLLAAAGMKAGADPVRWVQAAGFLAALGVVALALRLAVRDTGRGWALGLMAPALLVLSPPFALWSAGGLETPLFTLLVFAALTAEAWGPRSTHVRDVACGLLLGLAALTRPEGVLAAVLVFGDRALRRLRPSAQEEGVPRRSLVPLWLPWLALVLPYAVWRWQYYGFPLPNSYYAKVAWGPAQWLRGLEYAGRFLAASGGLTFALALAGVRQRPLAPHVRLLYAWMAAWTVYVVAVGGDGLGMYRFLVPVLPAACVLAPLGARGLLDALAPRSPGLRRWAAVCLVVGWAVLTVKPTLGSEERRFVERDKQFVTHWVTIGRWLGAWAEPGSTIAVTTAGAVPYYSRLPAIDMLGINDPVIAHRRMPGMGRGIAGHEKYDMAYVIGRRPTYLFHHLFLLTRPKLTQEQFVTPWNPGEADLLKDETFARLYEPVTERVGEFYLSFFRLRAAGADSLHAGEE